MNAKRRSWPREELLLVFRLYCRTPFGRLHQRNPEIIELAHLIERTPGAVAMKACNFASLDPQQQARSIKALGNVSLADRKLWESFLDDSEGLAQEAESAYSRITGSYAEDDMPDLGLVERARKHPTKKWNLANEVILPGGETEKEILVKTRRVQSFFRAAVLSSYDYHCALTGLAIPELLNASHIIPWSKDKKRRADPRNGICLNAFHDRAFDRGLISFDEDLRVIVSSTINKVAECDIHRHQLIEISGNPLKLPQRFQPERAALDYHRNHVFRR